jgi:hypothetical protein
MRRDSDYWHQLSIEEGWKDRPSYYYTAGYWRSCMVSEGRLQPLKHYITPPQFLNYFMMGLNDGNGDIES